MPQGVVLIKTAGERSKRILRQVKRIKGVRDTYPVFGRFDIVVFMEAKDFDEIRELALRVNSIPGIKSTETLPEA